MKPKALILQGWYQKPDANWYPWLTKELQTKGYEVFMPDLPTMHTDMPDMDKQIAFIENLLPIDEQTIIFGHSIGSLLGLRLAEKHSFRTLFLVAGWDYNDLTKGHKLFWPNKLNHEKIKRHVSDIYCISSDNDPYITAFATEEMSKRLGGTCMLIKGAGHFTADFGITKIPEIVPHIENHK